MRFSLGPAMLQHRREPSEEVIPSHSAPDEGTALLSNSPPRVSLYHRVLGIPKAIWQTLYNIWNPPLTGALLAILIGLIPPLKEEFYTQDGFFFGTITTSLINVGELFTALMLFVLGANLRIKFQGDGESQTPIGILVYIYVMRFIIMPVIAIIAVWKVSSWGWLDDSSHAGLGGDPMLKFILCLIPAGPPYV
jgi:auxin efflux carrier family protein